MKLHLAALGLCVPSPKFTLFPLLCKDDVDVDRVNITKRKCIYIERVRPQFLYVKQKH